MEAIFQYDELNQLNNGNFEMFYSIKLVNKKEHVRTIYGEHEVEESVVKGVMESFGYTEEAYYTFNHQLDPDPTESKFDFYMANEFDQLYPKDIEAISMKIWSKLFKKQELNSITETHKAVSNL